MPTEFGTGKTVFVLAIVAGCFAVLWPKLIYPMLQSTVKAPAESSAGCCDVIFENDVNAIKIMTEMCGNILHRYDDFDPKLSQAFQQGKLSAEVVATCRKEVLNTCGIDITAFLNERVRLGKTYKQILDDIRSFNSSVCLKLNFGVDPGLLGAPHRMRVGMIHLPSHHRQERPPHLRPDLLNNHPALQERGRTIPQTHIVPKVIEKEGRPPGPIPGMRPPMGGAGHVVPASKLAGGSTMGIIMPLYTIGIVVFFLYTMLRMMMKKPTQAGVCEDFSPDPTFRRMVFAEEAEAKPQIADENLTHHTQREVSPLIKAPEENGTRLVVSAITGLLAEADRQREVLARRAEEQYSLVETAAQVADEPDQGVTDATSLSAADQAILDAADQVILDSIPHESVDSGAKVKIVGMETTASCEGGQRWSRPGTPVLISSNSRSSTPLPPPTPEPLSIFLEGALPAQSQLLVTESETQVATGDDTGDSDPPVILSGKMTLSLISIDAALQAEEDHRRRALEEQHRIDEVASALRDEATPVPAISPNNEEEEEEYDDDDEEDEEEEEEEEEEAEPKKQENGRLTNDAHLGMEDAPSSTNYTTATSAAAEATGPEETAADFSAIESSLPDDQEEEPLEDEEEVWNGDIDSGDEEESEEEEEPEGILNVGQPQHQR